MSKLPRVAGLIFCKRMEINVAAVEMSLAGVFHTLIFSAFPAHVPFTVYTELYDAAAEGTMELAVMRLETERTIYRQTRWFASSDRQLVIQYETRVQKCIFPAPGRYAVMLRLDGDELTRRYLDIRAREKVR